jgi:hypothetical protein
MGIQLQTADNASTTKLLSTHDDKQALFETPFDVHFCETVSDSFDHFLAALHTTKKTVYFSSLCLLEGNINALKDIDAELGQQALAHQLIENDCQALQHAALNKHLDILLYAISLLKEHKVVISAKAKKEILYSAVCTGDIPLVKALTEALSPPYKNDTRYVPSLLLLSELPMLTYLAELFKTDIKQYISPSISKARFWVLFTAASPYLILSSSFEFLKQHDFQMTTKLAVDTILLSQTLLKKTSKKNPSHTELEKMLIKTGLVDNILANTSADDHTDIMTSLFKAYPSLPNEMTKAQKNKILSLDKHLFYTSDKQKRVRQLLDMPIQHGCFFKPKTQQSDDSIDWVEYQKKIF